jgi:hypothetical protein
MFPILICLNNFLDNVAKVKVFGLLRKLRGFNSENPSKNHPAVTGQTISEAKIDNGCKETVSSAYSIISSYADGNKPI